MTFLQCGSRNLDLARPIVMGVLNITPDSFSDGGRYLDRGAALEHARLMLAEGAAIIDVGAESTRPGADPVSDQEEMDRILPIVELLVRQLDVVVSVDTSTPAVMLEAASLGAGFINDVRALRRQGALEAAASTGLPVCLMHMQGEPGSMQRQPHYDDLLTEVERFFGERIEACVAAGIDHARIVVDPGFGFGKTLDHNLQMLRSLEKFSRLGCPVLVGVSRKAMLGAILGNAAVDQRLYAGVAAAAIAVLNGANIIRAHDVRATCDAVRMAAAIVG